MTDQQIVPGAGSTPVAITLDTAQQLLPKLAFAAYDGTGAAGDFLPVVKFVGPGGLVAGQAVGDVVTAGASVDQTWFRGVSKQGKGGIQFDVDNQGGYLQVETSGASPSGHGISLSDNATGNRLILGPTATLTSPGGVAQVLAGSNINIRTSGAGGNISLYNPNGPGMNVVDGGTYSEVNIFGDRIGFYAAPAIAQPTVTGSRGGNAALASLLTQLASLGLIINSTTP